MQNTLIRLRTAMTELDAVLHDVRDFDSMTVELLADGLCDLEERLRALTDFAAEQNDPQPAVAPFGLLCMTCDLGERVVWDN